MSFVLARSFSAVPSDFNGEPLLRTYDNRSHEMYLAWLADYLYRSGHGGVNLADLTYEEALFRLIAIETRIAFWIWDHPWKDYPPGLGEFDPGHADFPHRVEISHIISRVPSHEMRVSLLNLAYQELALDASK